MLQEAYLRLFGEDHVPVLLAGELAPFVPFGIQELRPHGRSGVVLRGRPFQEIGFRHGEEERARRSGGQGEPADQDLIRRGREGGHNQGDHGRPRRDFQTGVLGAIDTPRSAGQVPCKSDGGASDPLAEAGDGTEAAEGLERIIDPWIDDAGPALGNGNRHGEVRDEGRGKGLLQEGQDEMLGREAEHRIDRLVPGPFDTYESDSERTQETGDLQQLGFYLRGDIRQYPRGSQRKSGDSGLKSDRGTRNNRKRW